MVYYKGMNARVSYLLHYSTALRTLSLSALVVHSTLKYLTILNVRAKPNQEEIY